MGKGNLCPQMPAVSCSVRGVFIVISPSGTAPVVILTDGSGRQIPVFIGLSEAISIQSALNREVLPRPFTHDLFIEAFSKFGVRVGSLRIDSVSDGIYYAELVLLQDHREIRVDCRPSDGIAIALRASAPLLIDENILDGAGQTAEGLPQLVDLESFLKS